MKQFFAICLIMFALTANNFAFSQQDCGQIDCTGQCGRFIDENGDGYCDHGYLSDEVQAQLAAENEVQDCNTPLIIGIVAGIAVVACGVTVFAIRRKKNK